MQNLEADVFLLRLFLSWSIGAFILYCAIEVLRTSWMLKNRRFTQLLGKMGVGLLIFFVARMVAALIDNQYQFALSYSGYLVNYCFWFGVAYYCRKQRILVASEKIGADGRKKISTSIDEIIDEMTKEYEELTVG